MRGRRSHRSPGRLSSPMRNQRAPLLGVAAVVLAAALVLAACGDDTVGGGSDAEVTTAEAGNVEGKLTSSNWPGYIDPGKEGTVKEFERETGVDVDWMAKQMYDLGYLQEIDHNDLPNVFANLKPSLESPSFDPERKFSAPWQSGMGGIWVDTSKAPEIKSVNDLFDPKYKGKVTMLSELRETVPLMLLAEGIAPAEATTEDWLSAIEKIKKAADSGQIRDFTGNEYTEDLTSGNVVAAIGWSGDASIIENEDAEWRKPAEGCTLWSDNIVIPVGAPNTAAALGWTDFAYEPEVAADITEWVEYISPVEGVQEILEDRESELAESDLAFPSEEFTADCSNQDTPPELEPVNEAWQEVITG